MRVAIVHYWLVGMRGGEKVVEDLCRIYPQADIFTHVYDPSSVSPLLRARTVKTSFIDRLPGARRRYQSYLPLMPMALEQLDLRNYDLIICSESGPAKGIIPPPHALHVCYCHSPMRYVWNMYHDYRERTGFLTKRLMPLAAHYVRNWDALSATRVDHFVANSQTVRQRIERYYRRDAEVIYPPVEVDSFESAPDEVGDSFLMVGELVPYKRTELAIEAFNRMRLPLTVIGGGERLDAIRKLAGDTVTVRGPQPFDVLRREYARCRALMFPGEEDFGMVPVEAMASGRPVIAFGRGGATETVVDGVTGVLFDEQSVDAIVGAVQRFNALSFDTRKAVQHARRFAAPQFRAAFRDHVDTLLDSRRRGAYGATRDVPLRKPQLQSAGAIHG